MSTDPVLEAVHKELADYTLEPVEAEEALDAYCEDAKAFYRWTQSNLEEHLRRHNDAVGINQGMLMLVKQYFRWRGCVSKPHRNQIGDRGHICIFHVFEAAYQRLRRAELALNPPMLFLPPPHKQPSPTLLEGTILGLGE